MVATPHTCNDQALQGAAFSGRCGLKMISWQLVGTKRVTAWGGGGKSEFDF